MSPQLRFTIETPLCSYIFRNLDFSEEGYLTSLSDVRQYLKKESMRTHVRKINLGNMYCPSPKPMLTNIMMAENLVELNIIGIPFNGVFQLGWFLDALESLKKLSISWPEYSQAYSERIGNSFKRLKHLTVKVRNLMVLQWCMPYVSEYCEELEELRVLSVNKGCSLWEEGDWDDAFIPNFVVPPKLKVLAGYDTGRTKIFVDQIFASILGNNKQWTQFHPVRCAIETTSYYGTLYD